MLRNRSQLASREGRFSLPIAWGGIFMILWLARVDDYCAGLTSAVLLSCGDEQLCWGWVPRQDPYFCGRLTALLAFTHGGRSRA